MLSPGSRSAPLALALAQAARLGRIRLHVRIDERSAGFLALGLAKVSHRPVPVVCTSGSAVANLFPAVLEAAYAGVALVAITADRPPELRAVGANQTVDQVGFFGSNVRTAIDVLTFAHDDDAVRSWRMATDRILADAAGLPDRPPAPVQLNLAFREPLVPTTDWLDVPDRMDGVADRESVMSESVMREPISYVAADLGLSYLPQRGVIVVGDVPDRSVSDAAIALGEACGWPVVSEPSGNAFGGASSIPAAAVLLANEEFLASHQPELVVTIGRFGLSRPVMALVRSATYHLVVQVGGRDRPDPLRSAALVLGGVPRPPHADALVRWDGPDHQWLRSWQAAGLAVQQRIADIRQEPTVTGLNVADAVWHQATGRDVILAASSRTTRYFEAAITTRDPAPWVIGNRGTSGIDGLISTAFGAALALNERAPEARTYAVVGDLAFLHDHNGLLAPNDESRPNLTIVVVDNDGGGIFSSLEQGAPAYERDFERVFGTPTGLDLSAMTVAAGIACTTVSSGSALQELLSSTRDRAGLDVIVVSAADRATEADVWRRVLGFSRGSQ